ncbi:hypothetical protein [Falsiroseomonas sp. E2-1-a4]|uniref:hypothetical protein n=1 Tax=Falsiroseomonas sp. E2-1-a4 TaxID=3239299 RepID=UPI003F3C5DBE
MPELTASTREAARRIGLSDTAMHKAERAGRIAREPDGQCDIDKTRRRLTETADPVRSPLVSGAGAEGTPFVRLKVAQLALKVEAQRLSLDGRGPGSAHHRIPHLGTLLAGGLAALEQIARDWEAAQASRGIGNPGRIWRSSWCVTGHAKADGSM